MKYRALLEAINSKMDRNGNTYWALRYTDFETGQVICGTISGGESNIDCVRRHMGVVDGWDYGIMRQNLELPIREYNRLTKDWKYAGCSPEELAGYIRSWLGASVNV